MYFLIFITRLSPRELTKILKKQVQTAETGSESETEEEGSKAHAWQAKARARQAKARNDTEPCPLAALVKVLLSYLLIVFKDLSYRFVLQGWSCLNRIFGFRIEGPAGRRFEI